MKKLAIISSVIIFILFTGNLKAQVTPADYDTLYHAQVGPGIYHTEYEIRTVPWHIQVLEIDINQPGLEFRTVKANHSLAGVQRPSEMKTVLEDENTYVVGGVNGDFYQSGGVPVNAQVIDGQLLKKPYNRELIAFDEAFKPWIATTSFSGEVSNENFSAVINGVNETRNENSVAVYNTYFGNSTGTNEFGTEIALKLEGQWKVNAPVEFVVSRVEVGEGDMEFGEDEMILSAHGTDADQFEGLSVNDTLSVQLNLNPLNRTIIEAVGGSTQFVKNGIVNSNWEERHPRTAVGFSQDTSKVYFVVVDGRQSSSAGMKLGEMGEFMVSIGIANAINMDGGGSSAMLVQDEVANNPSDGGNQRAVGNALFVTLPDPGVGENTHIKMKPGYNKVFLGKKAYFSTFVFDEFHRFNRVPSAEVEYSAESHVGTINGNGALTASMGSGSGYVYASYGDFIDSARIEIIGADHIELHPRSVVLDTSMTFAPSFRIFDIEGNEQTINSTDINWSLTNPEAGEVDEEGNFTPKTFGTVGLVASFDTVTDTVWTEVEQNEGFEKIVQFSAAEDWTIETENLDQDRVTLIEIEDGNAIEVNFSYPPQAEQAQIFLKKPFQISGVPSFGNVSYSSDGQDYVLTLDIETREGGRFRMAPPAYANVTDPDVMHFTFEQAQTIRLTTGSLFYFPFTMESVNIQLPKNQTGEDIEGYFRLYSAGVSYGNVPTSIDENPSHEIPDQIELSQNYPNPFNPSTNISFSLPKAGMINLSVYDVVGRKVATVAEGRIQAGSHTFRFDASNLASGIYLYRLETPESSLSRKMILIK